jgi:hypothetical protein
MPRHLNKHIVYSDSPAACRCQGAKPRDSVGDGGIGDGATLYVAAFGSRKIGVFSTLRSRPTRSCPTRTATSRYPAAAQRLSCSPAPACTR